MVDKRNRRVSGTYCVAGSPGVVSCTNSSLTPGISMRLFPSNEGLRQIWTKFVQKHRPGFKPTKTSVLCSVHFTSDSFARRVDFGDQSVRRLEKGSFPTIDVAVKKDDLAISKQERRTVSLIICNIYMRNYCYHHNNFEVHSATISSALSCSMTDRNFLFNLGC